jgi:thymidine phosphorylase
VAEGAGLRTAALLTDMGQVLGHDVGNALEVREAIGVLAGHRRDDRLHTVTAALAGELLVRGGLARDLAAATAAVDAALSSGAAAERFARMITALGGPHDLVEHPERHLARAPIEQPVWPAFDGFVERIDARSLGLIVVELGGGRRRVEDAIDSAVGLAGVRGVGDTVDRERPLAIVHARSTAAAEAAAKKLREAITVSAEPNAGSASPILRRMAR